MAPKKSSASPKKDSGVSKTKGGRPIPPRSKAATALAERKMKQLGGPAKTTPYPSFSSPTEAECEAVVQALEKEHGKPPQQGQYRFEDDEEGAEPTDRGIADGVLDAVIRCILTLNTNARNYRVNKRALDDRFGYSDYEAIQKARLEDIVDALRKGGLANVKGKTIKTLLDDLASRIEGLPISLKDSLEYLHDLDDDEAMLELLSLHGVGAKTAGAITSYALGRDVFAVDTHIFRITKALGWIPAEATRETAHSHLNARIPGRLQYDFIIHGRACKDCTALGVTAANPVAICPLKPFLDGKRPADIQDAEEEKKEGKTATKATKRAASDAGATASPSAKKGRKKKV